MHAGADDFVQVVGGISVAMPTAIPVLPLAARRAPVPAAASVPDAAIEVWAVIDGALARLTKQQVRVARQSRFGVAHGGK